MSVLGDADATANQKSMVGRIAVCSMLEAAAGRLQVKYVPLLCEVHSVKVWSPL